MALTGDLAKINDLLLKLTFEPAMKTFKDCRVMALKPTNSDSRFVLFRGTMSVLIPNMMDCNHENKQVCLITVRFVVGTIAVGTLDQQSFIDIHRVVISSQFLKSSPSASTPDISSGAPTHSGRSS